MLEKHPDQNLHHYSYAQNAEDLMVLNLFKLIYPGMPAALLRYLDIGAHHPTNISNTKLFYQLGAVGMVVDPNHLVIKAFHAERPNDIAYCVAAADKVGITQYYKLDDTSGRNSLVKAELEQFCDEYGYDKTKITEEQIATTTLNNLLGTFKTHYGTAPHFLSLDTEGMDYRILKAAELTHDIKPTIICVEAKPPYDVQIAFQLNAYGYISLCRMGDNLIFVQEQYKGKVY